MVIVQEKKEELTSERKLEKIVSLLGSISLSLDQLAMRLGIITFKEGYIQEGTLDDRKYVDQKIKELQSFANQLEEINLFLNKQEDLQSSFEKKQGKLTHAQKLLPLIKGAILDIWKMKDSASSLEDNQIIINLMKLMFNRINSMIKKIEIYVIEYNKISNRKLDFKVKWTPLPK